MRYTLKSMNINVGLGDGGDIRLALNTHQIASTTEARGQALEVVRGSVWITLDGKFDDYVLNPGERLPINSRGRVVIQALAPTEVKFVRPPELAFATPGIGATKSRSHHPGDCWRNFVGGLSVGRLNIDTPL